MGNYDIERERQKSEEIRKAFREIFPLADENDLPWAACHIKDFLRQRIKREVQEGTHRFVSRVCRVLCEISPPKTHVEDMARIVVEAAKEGRRHANDVVRLKEQIAKLTAERDRLKAAVDQVGQRTVDRAEAGQSKSKTNSNPE